MPTRKLTSSREIANATAALVAIMPPEQAAQVYDFARFLRARPTPSTSSIEGADDWLNDSDDDLLAEDAVWEAVYEQHRDKFLVMREAAISEIEQGSTEEMFGIDGDIAL